MGTIIMLVVLGGMIWFMQRSQRKQAQERQNQLKELAKGDEIVTIDGLYGVIDEVDEDNQKMILDIDGVYLTFELSALKRVINRAEQETVEPETTVIEEATETEAVVEGATEEASTDTAIESKD
ncbi:preprotein translocase subunit YajC [Streptococcus macedonicus]|uniref:preprotein translocase subunit YajC n=1 Tax=Streptococcus macedonicus TaxID=59310 RepID=UPI002243E4FA|nr:preprotein translocase subunit YajC [Streptococcus macedonicus]MCW8519196.1 preprotein translocase subunit YajC [Streptococcus macedonicus]MCW8521025.1 preprotein translocase subunit YajC [Streptococcus macedonicus]